MEPLHRGPMKTAARVQLGGGVHRYEGRILSKYWANNPNVSTLDGDYYTGDAVKDDANIYAKYAVTSNNLWSTQMHNTVM